MKISQLIERQTRVLEKALELKGTTQTRPGGYGIYETPIRQAGKAALTFNDPPTGQALIDDSRPMYDSATRLGGFFQDMSLEKGIFNLLINPTPGIANDIPIEPNNILESKTGYLVRYQYGDVPGSTVGGGCCESCSEVEGDWDFAKIKYPYGKLCRSATTICINELILKARAYDFDNFYIIGNYRGVSGTIKYNTFRDRDTVIASAVQRKMAFLGSYFQEWVLKRVWTGDPSATPNNAQEKQFYGLLRLITDSYGSAGNPFGVEVTSGDINDATALNSLVIDANTYDANGDAVIGNGTFTLYQMLLDAEQQLYYRASTTNMLPVRWVVYLNSATWAELTEKITCEKAAYGCFMPDGDCVDKAINLTDSAGNLTLMALAERQQMRQMMSIELNGRTYPVRIDDNMPYTMSSIAASAGLPKQSMYKSSIFFIPFTVAGGARSLYWEHIDYSQIDSYLQPIPGTRYNAHGWSDGGLYQHIVHQVNKCMKVTVEMQMRLILKAPQLCLRIDNVGAKLRYELPFYYNPDGTRSKKLVQ